MAKKIVHPGTSQVFELIPLVQLQQLQSRFPILKRLKRGVR